MFTFCSLSSRKIFSNIFKNMPGELFSYVVCWIDVTSLKAEFMLLSFLFNEEMEENCRKYVNGFS